MNAIIVGIVTLGLAGLAPRAPEGPVTQGAVLEILQPRQLEGQVQQGAQQRQQTQLQRHHPQRQQPPQPQQPQPQPQQQQQQQQQGEQRELIDINTATSEQLQRVPGIGETLARRIIEFRTEHGPFEKVDDLLNVQGIGTTSLDKMRPFLTVKPKG
jgi:comEA protein